MEDTKVYSCLFAYSNFLNKGYFGFTQFWSATQELKLIKFVSQNIICLNGLLYSLQSFPQFIAGNKLIENIIFECFWRKNISTK